MTVTFFRSPADLRAWMKQHHATMQELWVGFYKKNSGRPSITWPESVDEALCVGWIDGVRRRLDEVSYVIRFTPRKTDSTWSAVNIRRVEALTAHRRMRPAGLKAFQARQERKSRTYSYEQETVELGEPYATMLRKNKTASRFFQAQAAGYRHKTSWWVMSAKTEKTQLHRLKKLIDASARGRLA